MSTAKRQKTIVVGAGPVGALAALYAARRGHDVEVYELRGGKSSRYQVDSQLSFPACIGVLRLPSTGARICSCYRCHRYTYKHNDMLVFLVMFISFYAPNVRVIK
jgi:phytoene dehydrogenase-like protein